MSKKFTIKEKKISKAKAAGGKEYNITIPKVDTDTKDKWEDGKDEITITGVKITELDSAGKETTTKNDSASATLIYKKGNLFNYFKVKEVDGKTFEEKEQKEVSTEGLGSYRLTFWAMIVVLLVVLGGFIWWWISSSRKEEKEEEGL